MTATLTLSLGDHHGHGTLNCEACGEHDQAVDDHHFSFYPAMGFTTASDEPGACAISTGNMSLGSFFLPTEGRVFSEFPTCRNRGGVFAPLISQEVVIGEERAREVYQFVTSKHAYSTTGVGGYNCIDFIQEAYELSGGKVHYTSLEHFQGQYSVAPRADAIWAKASALDLNGVMWATVAPTHLYFARELHGTSIPPMPVALSSVVTTAIAAAYVGYRALVNACRCVSGVGSAR